MFSTTQVPDQEDEDFELLTQLVIYGLKERIDSGLSSADKRRASHEAKEVSEFAIQCMNEELILYVKARSARTSDLQCHRDDM